MPITRYFIFVDMNGTWEPVFDGRQEVLILDDITTATERLSLLKKDFPTAEYKLGICTLI